MGRAAWPDRRTSTGRWTGSVGREVLDRRIQDVVNRRRYNGARTIEAGGAGCAMSSTWISSSAELLAVVHDDAADYRVSVAAAIDANVTAHRDPNSLRSVVARAVPVSTSPSK
jgi:hypothetical protein